MQNELVEFGEIWNGWILHLVGQDLFKDADWFHLFRGKSHEFKLFEGQQAIKDDMRSAIVPLVVSKDLVKLANEVVIVKVKIWLRLTGNIIKHLVLLSGLIDRLHHVKWVWLIFNGQFLIQWAAKIKVWLRCNNSFLHFECLEIVNKIGGVEVFVIRGLMFIKWALFELGIWFCKGYWNLVTIQTESWTQAVCFSVSCDTRSFGPIFFLKIAVNSGARDLLAIGNSLFPGESIEQHDINFLAFLLNVTIGVDHLLKQPAWDWNDDVVTLSSITLRKSFENFFKNWIMKLVVMMRWVVGNFIRIVTLISIVCHHDGHRPFWMGHLELRLSSPKTSHWLWNSQLVR